jgi:mRNA interferase RelE/StbE
VSYSLESRPEVRSDFKQLDKTVATRILKKLQWLSEQGDNVTHQPLSANLTGFYKLRVGDYRVIYKLESEIKRETDEPESKDKGRPRDSTELSKEKTGPEAEDKKVVVYVVGHRPDIYKKLE